MSQNLYIKRNRREVVSRPNIRYCLYEDCKFPLEEGNYLCIEHGVQAIDDWCYNCGTFTKYHYPEDQRWSMGVAGSRNPRWSQVDYVFGTMKCKKCGKEGTENNNEMLMIFLFYLLGIPGLVLYLFAQLSDGSFACFGLMGLIFFYYPLIISFLDSKGREDEQFTPVSNLDVKIASSLGERKSKSMIEKVKCHIKGEYLGDYFRTDFDRNTITLEEYNKYVKPIIEKELQELYALPKLRDLNTKQIRTREKFLKKKSTGDHLLDSVKLDIDRFGLSITLKEYNKIVKPIIEKELQDIYALPKLRDLTTKQNKTREKFLKKKSTIGSFEEWKKTNVDGIFEEYREFFKSK